MHRIVSSQSKMMHVYDCFGLSCGRSQILLYVSLESSYVRICWFDREAERKLPLLAIIASVSVDCLVKPIWESPPKFIENRPFDKVVGVIKSFSSAVWLPSVLSLRVVGLDGLSEFILVSAVEMRDRRGPPWPVPVELVCDLISSWSALAADRSSRLKGAEKRRF